MGIHQRRTAGQARANAGRREKSAVLVVVKGADGVPAAVAQDVIVVGPVVPLPADGVQHIQARQLPLQGRVGRRVRIQHPHAGGAGTCQPQQTAVLIYVQAAPGVRCDHMPKPQLPGDDPGGNGPDRGKKRVVPAADDPAQPQIPGRRAYIPEEVYGNVPAFLRQIRHSKGAEKSGVPGRPGPDGKAQPPGGPVRAPQNGGISPAGPPAGKISPEGRDLLLRKPDADGDLLGKSLPVNVQAVQGVDEGLHGLVPIGLPGQKPGAFPEKPQRPIAAEGEDRMGGQGEKRQLLPFYPYITHGKPILPNPFAGKLIEQLPARQKQWSCPLSYPGGICRARCSPLIP